MAFTLQSNLNLLSLPNPYPNPAISSSGATTTSRRSYVPIHCGPRSNRGPLLKGRILSTEAIHAIQSLKRAQRTDPATLDAHVSKTLSRLIKSDLIAAFKELIRQDQIEIAVKVFSIIRSEYHPPGLNLYAEVVAGLARKGLNDAIDGLISDLVEKEGAIQCNEKGLIELVKAVIAAGRRGSTVMIYGLMKKGGWGSSPDSDEYVGQVLSKGLRTMGEEKLADEIDAELLRLSRAFLAKSIV